MRPPHWPSWIVPFALALIAALVLHDVTMAGDPHAPSSQAHADHSVHDGSQHHAVSHGVSTTAVDVPHPSGCGAVIPAVAPRAATTASGDASHVLARPVDAGLHPLVAESPCLPGRSPTVLRALLQVYRI